MKSNNIMCGLILFKLEKQEKMQKMQKKKNGVPFHFTWLGKYKCKPLEITFFYTSATTPMMMNKIYYISFLVHLIIALTFSNNLDPHLKGKSSTFAGTVTVVTSKMHHLDEEHGNWFQMDVWGSSWAVCLKTVCIKGKLEKTKPF